MSAVEPLEAMPRISYTLFPDLGAKTKTDRQNVPWQDMVDIVRNAPTYLNKRNCPLVSLCQYGTVLSGKDSLRHAENVISAYGAELDYDGEIVQPTEAARTLQAADIEALIYTSPSHTPERPRFRILFPFSAGLPPERRADCLARANRVLGGIAARESFTLSQSYYIGRVGGTEYIVLETHGRTLDLVTNIEPLYFGGGTNEAASRFDTTTDEELRDEFARGENRYQAMLTLSMRWAARGMTADDIAAVLIALLGTNAKNADGIDLRTRIEGIAGSAVRKFGETRRKSTVSFPLTDLGNAERLAAAHGGPEGNLRYLPEVGWVRYEKGRFVDDRERRVMVVAADVARSIYEEARSIPDEATRKRTALWAVKSESRRSLEAMVALAQSRPGLVDLLERYDRHPQLLAVKNGVVDLETGQIREGRREDRLRMQANVVYDEGATAPTWLSFLDDIFGADAELIAFMARALGYSLGGSTNEQVLFIAYGTGANGKTTAINVVRRVLAEYAKTIQPETLMHRDRVSIPNDIARLRGVRFVSTAEVEDGKKLAESIVKQMTGGDEISARFMRQEFFDFVPAFKLWIITNHRPVITGTDHAIWRRILLVPFTVTIPPEKRDMKLEQRLMTEAPGILNWLIKGYREWREKGLLPPTKVVAATAKYRNDMDRIGTFIKERCTLDISGERTRKTQLYAEYKNWCEEAGVYAMRKMLFHEKCVDEHRLKLVSVNGYEWYDRVGLNGDM
jgi:P4 family phage/plasmid primase-like protien